MRPGTYTVGTRNPTLQAYADVTYNGPAGGSATAQTGGANADDSVGAFVEGVHTNKDGDYRMWLLPGDYAVHARGQSAFVTAGIGNPVSFASLVGQATATITTDGVPGEGAGV